MKENYLAANDNFISFKKWRLTWNKIILAAKTIYFISDVVPCKPKIL